MKEGWTFLNFEDCIEKCKKTKQLKTSDYLPEGKYPIVSQESDLISGYTNMADYVNDFGKPIVVFGDHSRVVKYIDFAFAVGADGVKILIPTNDFHPKFFYYYLHWHGVENLGYSRHYKLLKEINVPIPPLSEQQHIVEELDLLSSIIEKKKAQLNELDNLAQSLFYEMFGAPISNEKGWDSNVLENVVASDCSISYGIVQPGDDVFDGIPVVRPVDLISNVVKREGLKRVAKNISDSYRRTILKGGEILLCVRGTTGVMSFASDSLAGCNVTRGITPLSFERRLNRDYVFAYLSSQYIQDIIADNTRGATLKQINMKDVRKLPVQIPPLDLQNQFAEKVQAIEHQKELIKQSIKEVESLFNSRMDYYFN